MKKQILKETFYTVLLLAAATGISFGFFYLGNKNIANITVTYTLALILTALYTSGYLYGIIASLFCVIAVNYFFSYPYFKVNFSLHGYPVTFFGMLAISLITSTTTTALKRQRLAIAEREKALAEADREKLRANLLRAVSHDLRTPLTSIIGSSSSYLEHYPEFSEEERTELVANIREDSQWLLNMVENLLTVTRIKDQETDQVRKSPEVVEEVVSEAILRLRKRLPDIRIHVNMPETFLMLSMDPTLIEQVLINLLENAFIHSGSSDPIDLTICDLPDAVSFQVKDYGKGIDEVQMPYIFEGQQRTSDTADVHKGIGIGLSICKTIIQAHGGTITAANHPDGAEFTFILPKEKEDQINV
ncbi:MAG TPA: DUF4118 domain-containing protein [Candidatus Mediterraneibacter quadrami]|uniref:histidine kinase n=1 Tax=Candidatus Mediterraneibacter quadrami TaxID=2838684 RepID=A0A9D2RGJ8_9FIRM|nr:DUF4118 domain-containing protein [Candidatus Mediterraneibacter quadrami]